MKLSAIVFYRWLVTFPFVIALYGGTASAIEGVSLPFDLQKIADRGKLTVVMLRDEAVPFFMNDTGGRLFGFDVDLANDIARRLGVEVEFKREAKTYDDIVKLVAERRGDIAVSNLSRTIGRAKYVRFTEPYIVLHQTLLVNRLAAARQRRGQDPLKILNHTDVKIGTIGGSSYINFAEDAFPQATIVPYTDREQAIQDVLDEKIVAFMFDNMVIKNWHFEHPEGGLLLQTTVMKEREDPISFAVPWDSTHLLSWLELYLREIKKNGFLDELVDKFINNDQWRQRWQPQKQNQN
ncbi:MAG TPA: ABC transporter substrate-binding protein [Desulfatiglandales bacterium]|nr:ABC transporter substrate-binding protein [Desulfatiglandales bacterium]